MVADLLLTVLLSLVQGPPHYALERKIPIGGEGGWDCIEVDSASQRLFISRGTHVMVLDVVTGKIMGDIPNTNGVHDIALVPRLKKGFITDGRENAVTVFDLATLKETNRIPVGEGPDVMAYDAVSNLVFTLNGGSNDATVIDANTEKVVGTVKLDGKPEFARPDGKGSLFVNIEDKSTIDKVDIVALKVVSSWPLSPGEGPTGMAIDAKRGLLFSACDNEMMAVSDFKTGKVVSTAKVGKGPDGAAFDEAMGLAFCPNGRDGTLTVIGKDYSVVQTVVTQRGARTMALDPKTHKIYLIAAEYEPAAEGQRPRMVPGSATILVVSSTKV
jgi:YVTN family beta-propeller protein